MGFFKDFLGGTTGAAEKANKANHKANMALLNKQYAYGESALLKGLSGIQTGYANAAGMLAKQGQAATNQILAGQKQTVDAGTQGLIDKGLYNTSAAGNMANQAQAQTNQQLMQLHEGLGAQQAGLEVGKAGAMNNAQMNLAQYAMSKATNQSAMTPQYTGQPGFLAGMAGGVGQALGSWATGGFGTGGGKMTETPNKKVF